jgi:hypothetical protein
MDGGEAGILGQSRAFEGPGLLRDDFEGHVVGLLIGLDVAILPHAINAFYPLGTRIEVDLRD